MDSFFFIMNYCSKKKLQYVKLKNLFNIISNIKSDEICIIV